MLALEFGFAHFDPMVEAAADISESVRNAMRRVASTVNVISICVDGQPMAITATAVSSLPLESPCLLACSNRAASVHASMGAMSHFCVNVLHRDPESVAQIFADRAQHALRFASGWDIDCAPAPRLIDAQASFLCRRTDS